MTIRRPSSWKSVPIVVAVLAVGACSLGAADSFADEYSDYLRGRADVASFQVRPNNGVLSRGSVDTLVMLRDGLSDEQVAQAARELADHRVGRRIGEHRIRVGFSAADADGRPATAEIYLIPESGNRRLGDPSTYLPWVHRTRQLVAAGSGIAAVHVWRTAISVTASGDVYPVAESVDRFVAAEPGGLTELSATGSTCVLQWDAGDPLSALAPYRDLVALLPAEQPPAHCRATSQKPARRPAFYITVARGTPADVVDSMRERAARQGLSAEITVGV